jgi:hypothetical protein
VLSGYPVLMLRTFEECWEAELANWLEMDRGCDLVGDQRIAAASRRNSQARADAVAFLDELPLSVGTPVPPERPASASPGSGASSAAMISCRGTGANRRRSC